MADSQHNPLNIDNASNLYRVQIVQYPEGAAIKMPRSRIDQTPVWTQVRGWAPNGWTPDDKYLKSHPTRQFRWPSTKHWYRSRRAAETRARLIESFGATVSIVKSQPIVWQRQHALQLNIAEHGDSATTDRTLADAGLQLAYDIAEVFDHPDAVRNLVEQPVAGLTSAEHSLVLEHALEYFANHVVGHLVFCIEYPFAVEGDVRSWLANEADYFRSAQ